MYIDLTIGSIMLGVALLLLVMMVLARPLMAPPERPEEELAEEAEILYYRKEAILRQVRELDDDLESGKVATELYQRTRPGLVAQAALLMKKLDEMGAADFVPASAATASLAAAVPADVDAQIEAAVRKLRTPEEIDAQIEAAVKAKRTVAATATAVAAPSAAAAAKNSMGYCPKCGRGLEAGDRFCAKCGYDLKSDKSAVKAA